MAKDLGAMIEAASQEPVPYEGLSVLSEAPRKEREDSAIPIKEENSSHKSGSKSLIDAAVRTPKSDDQT